MPGKTPNGIPYVLPNDTIATFPTVSKQIAEAVDKSRELVGAWIPLKLTGGWEAFSAFGMETYAGLRVRKLPSGIQIEGAVKGGMPNAVMADLPTQFKVKYVHFVQVVCNSPGSFMRISPSSSGVTTLSMSSDSSITSPVFIHAIVAVD